MVATITRRLAGSDRDIRSLLAGSAGVLVISIVGQFVVYLVQGFVSRRIGPDEYGIYALAFTWFNILLIGALLGFDTGSLRFIPNYGTESLLADRFRKHARRFVLTSSTAVAVATVIAAAILPLGDGLAATLAAGALLLPVWSVYRLFHSELQVLRWAPMAQAYLGLLRPLAWLGVIVAITVAAPDRLNATSTMLSHVAAMVIITGATIATVAWRRHRAGTAEVVDPVDGEQAGPKYWTRVSIPLSFVAGMRLLLNRLDIVLIGILIGPAEAGIYAVAARAAQLTAIGLSSSNQVVAPMVSRLAGAEDRGALASLVKTSSAISTASVIALAAIAIPLSGTLLGYYGPRFQEGRSVFIILCVMQGINALTGPVGHMLNMTGFQDLNSKILLVILVLNGLLNYPAIERYGIVGAAVVTATLSSTKNIWTWWEVRRRLHISSLAFGLFAPKPMAGAA